ncbi:hypothetical protein BCEP4_680063 [Burkholderia cepacia]|nr:hypothetical protein BCEP4_680063 [Burkholderia cepacia]
MNSLIGMATIPSNSLHWLYRNSSTPRAYCTPITAAARQTRHIVPPCHLKSFIQSVKVRYRPHPPRPDSHSNDLDSPNTGTHAASRRRLIDSA